MCRFGVPDSIHTNQELNFIAKIMKEICSLLDIKKTRTTAYHPQSDSVVERFKRNVLGIAVREDEQRYDFLPTLLHATIHHATTGSTQFELMFQS